MLDIELELSFCLVYEIGNCICVIFFLEFATVCAQSTDFHFPELAEQLSQVEVEVVRHNEEKPRAGHAGPGDTGSVTSGSSDSSGDSQVMHIEILFLSALTPSVIVHF